MIIIEEQYNKAHVYADVIDAAAEGQIRALCRQPFLRGSVIRIMPDVHAGKGCTVGTTMTVTDAVVPSLVGVDIGCGMLTVRLKEWRIDLPALDSCIRKSIPSGMTVRDCPPRGHERIDLDELRCVRQLSVEKARASLGTLGGGNHFIEIDRDDDGALYLVIHTGSRNAGLCVAEWYQKKAYDAAGGRSQTEIPYELAPLTGEEMRDYLADMQVMQRFAELNRRIIKETILSGMKLHEESSFETVHNYIDTEAMILRKGAVSAKTGETLLIPINMRDGSLLCTGRGNGDWNDSAPHGAGRLFSRKDTESRFTVSQYKKEMSGVFTTSVSRETLDECPMAYKPMESILSQIKDAVTVEAILRPIYNFKAGGEQRAEKPRDSRQKHDKHRRR